jgi:hypothetical protein
MAVTTLYPETEAERAAIHARLLRGHYQVSGEVSGEGRSGSERRGWVRYVRGHQKIDVVRPPAGER